MPVYKVQMKVRLAGQSITINALRSQVFQGKPHSETGERATISERDSDRMLVEFISRDGRKLYRTLEEVMLYPGDRITFQHLESPLHYASEEFRLTEVSGGIHITYRGEIKCRTLFLPGVGWLIAFLYVRPRYGSVVRQHMGMLKKAGEAPGANHIMEERG